MKILFDHGVPAPLRHHLPPNVVDTAYEKSWSNLQNGDLLAAAEADAYEVLISTDQKMKYQQNLAARRIAMIVLLSTSWPRIQRRIRESQSALGRAKPGSYEEVPV